MIFKARSFNRGGIRTRWSTSPRRRGQTDDRAGGLRGSRIPCGSPSQLIRRVYRYVAYRIGDGPDADDVTSDVFELAVRYRSRFDPQRGEAAAWLLGIARRAVADHLADRSMAAAHEVPEQPDKTDVEGESLQRLSMIEVLGGTRARPRTALPTLRRGLDCAPDRWRARNGDACC